MQPQRGETMADNPTPPSPSAVVGWRETVALPGLGIERLIAKIDTGARSSSLHAFAIEPFRQYGAPWVRFGVHPRRRNTREQVWCEAPVVDQRAVRPSSGQEFIRYFISTRVTLGELTWDIELSLADRVNMGYRMLLGRTALAERFCVDPAQSFLRSSRSHPKKTSKRVRT